MYVRPGGGRGLAALVRELFGRAQADALLGRFWARRSTYCVLREEKLLVDYVSLASGGPARYVSRDLKTSHQALGITAQDWEIFQAHLKATLGSLLVPEAEGRELANLFERLKADIVQG